MEKIQVMKIPKKVVIPLEQHLDLLCRPLVNVGDVVKVGQKIGEGDVNTPPIHSSVSGEVVEISELPHPYGREVLSVVIETDDSDTSIEFKPTEDPSQEEIKDIIKEAGIVGRYRLGRPARLESVDTVILNATDIHPYISADRAIISESHERIIEGLKILMKTVNASHGFIGINATDSDTIGIMEKETEHEPNIRVVPLKMVYARGMGRLLAHAVAKRSRSTLGSVMISTVLKAKSVYEAVYMGRPQIETVITVVGARREPTNVLARVGTLFRDIIEFCGGYGGKPKEIIMNGPMTGLAQYTDEVPAIRGTYGILIKYDIEIEEPIPCIRCAKCVDVCPVNLLPNTIAIYAENNRLGECKRYNIFSCVECGYCAYECPSRIPILQLIRYAKANLTREGA